MGIFGYKAPSTNGGRLGFGVHKIKITEANVKLSAAGLGYNVSVTVETEEGVSSKFVSLGYYPNVPDCDTTLFESAKSDFDTVKSNNRAIYAEKNEVEKAKLEAKAKSFKETAFKNPYYNLVDGLTSLAEFVSGFSKEAREAVSNVDVDSIEALLQAYMKILTTSGYAYCFLYQSTSTSKDGSKVYTNVNLKDSYSPRSFSVNQVVSVEPTFKTKDDEKVLSGYTVKLLSGKSVTLPLNEKTFKGGNVPAPTDSRNEDTSSEVVADDLPF